MDGIELIMLVILILVVNPAIIVNAITKNVQNVWNGEFEIILDNGQVIPGSFENDYVNGIDIPRGLRVKEIIIKQVTRGFIPMVITSKIKTTLESFSTFPENAQLKDLCYEVTNPEVLPDLFVFMVASNQRIVHKEQSYRGLFFPKREILIWYNRPGAES